MELSTFLDSKEQEVQKGQERRAFRDTQSEFRIYHLHSKDPFKARASVG